MRRATGVLARALIAASASFENHIGRVRIDAVDAVVRDRVVGHLLSISPPKSTSSQQSPRPASTPHWTESRGVLVHAR